MVRRLSPLWGVDRRCSIEIRTIGIDLGRTVFHLVGPNARGEVAVRKKCSRDQILRFTANLQVTLIGMEAAEVRTFWLVPCVNRDMMQGRCRPSM